MRFFNWIRRKSNRKSNGSRRQAKRAPASFERLEDRRVLSAVPAAIGGLELRHAESKLPAELVNLDDQVTVTADQLYGRLNAQDHGDFYWNGTEKVSLWRADNDVVIRLDSGVESKSVLDALTGAAGLLTGHEVAKELGSNAFILAREMIGLGETLDWSVLRGIAGVSWAGPLFT